MPLNTPPLGYTGQFATLQQAEQGTSQTTIISPYTMNAESLLDFASPPAIGSTTPNAGTFTTLNSSGNTTLASGAATTLNLATGTGGKTVHIADGAGVNAVTVGSTNTTSATTVQSGSGGIALTGAVTGSSTIKGTAVYATGDPGGVAASNGLSNASSTTIGAGVGSVAMSTGNAATNTAWLKVYIGATAYWIPAWTTNAP